MEHRLVERHPAGRADAARRSRQEAAAEAVRLSPDTAVREFGQSIRRLLARTGAA